MPNTSGLEATVHGKWISAELTVQNKCGIHARPAALIVKKCSEFDRKIFLSKPPEQDRYNCKSIMGLMSMGAGQGTRLRLHVEGADNTAMEICQKLYRLLTSDFDEVY